MNYRCLVIVCLCIAHVVFGELPDDIVASYADDFAKYQIYFDKHYDSKEEYDKRLRAYANSMEMSKKLNALRSFEGAHFGETSRSDTLPEEVGYTFVKPVDAAKVALGKSYKENTFPQPLFAQQNTAENMPSEFNWLNVSGVKRPARSQGSCGCCWAFSGIGQLEMQSVLEGNPFYNISVQQGVDCSLNASTHGCCGGWPGYIYSESKQFVTEEDYPYVLHNWTKGSACSPSSCRIWTYPKVIEINGYDEFIPMTAQELKKQIWMYGPISVSMDIVASFNNYKGGIMDCSGQAVSGSHNVVAVGFGPNYIICRNSWGTDWGMEGDFKITDKSPQASCNILSTDYRTLRLCRVSVKALSGSSMITVGSAFYLVMAVYLLLQQLF